MPITHQQVVDYVRSLSLSELQELISALERELGVSLPPEPSSLVAMGAPVVDSHFDFEVHLLDPGPSRLEVISETRHLLGIGIAAGKTLVDSAPVLLREGLTREEAMTLQARLRGFGAVVEVRRRKW